MRGMRDEGVVMGDGKAEVISIKDRVQGRVKEEDEKYGSGSGGSGAGDQIDSEFILKCLDRNELGDGELFKRIHRDKFLFNKATTSWLVWTGHHWEIDHMGVALADVERVCEAYAGEAIKISKEINSLNMESDKAKIAHLSGQREALNKRAKKLRAKEGRQSCLHFAQTSDDSISIKGDEIDREPWLLACANGVINLKTGEFRPGRQTDYLMKASPIEWKGIDEPCPQWEKFQAEIHEEDMLPETERLMAPFLRRLFGYSLVGACVNHIFVVLYGADGRNGKSTTVEILSDIMGSLAGPIRSEMLLDQKHSTSSAGPSPDIMTLKGLRMAFASETDDGCRISPSRVKLFTGNDELRARNPNDKYETAFKPSHTLFLLTNFRPHADASDMAFWQRVYIIPFNLMYLIDEEPAKPNQRKADKDLSEKLKKEASGILAWLVRGCLEWQKIGLNPPPKVRAARDDYRNTEDNISAFIEYCCYRDPDAESGSTELYEKFERWWKKHVSNFPMKHKKFGMLMKKEFRSEKVGGVYRYYGIGINQDDDV